MSKKQAKKSAPKAAKPVAVRRPAAPAKKAAPTPKPAKKAPTPTPTPATKPVAAKAPAAKPVKAPEPKALETARPARPVTRNGAMPAASPAQTPSNPQVPAAKPVAGPEGDTSAQLGTIKSASGVDLTEKIKELVRLAQEQGYLTYGDINDALPDNLAPEDLDEIYIKLRNLEIDIVDQAEVDRPKAQEAEEEQPDDKARLDILDDPVRMYLKQMGQVPLLTREQEVEISKRIEDNENEVKRIIHSFGFSGKEHIALAEKLISEPPKERFDRVIVDKKIETRD
ncbi:MAG: RNA polymerase sigma factor region1.1 domain-containing protein, partial [Limisphaerales bacterium]